MVTENYPQLKSDALFHDLMSQLEGTENRITVARNRYIKAVQDYNVGIRTFPNNLTAMAFGYKDKAELHGREREGNLDRAEGGFQSDAGRSGTSSSSNRIDRR